MKVIRNPRIIKRNFEIWKPIEDFSGYEISNMGRVRSLDKHIIRWGNISCLYSGKILKLITGGHGYSTVGLYFCNKANVTSIHILVIKHFGPPKPSPKHECNHIDGDKSNNWWTNLEWLTHQQNMQHSYDTGLNSGYGENCNLSKLTEKEVTKIRKLYSTGKFTQMELAEKFHSDQTNISCIVNYKTWKSTGGVI